MVYVLWTAPATTSGGATAPGGGMGAMAGAAGGVRLPALGLALAAGVCGYVVWLLDRLPAARALPLAAAGAAFGEPGLRPAGPSGQPGPVMSAAPALLAPRAATCCKIAMGVAMGVMLIDVL